MIKLDWLLLARHVSVDRDSNSPSVFGVLSSIRAEGFPVLLPQVAVVGLLRRGRDRDKGTLTLSIAHNGKKQFQSQFNYDFNGKKDNHLAITVHGFIIPAPGKMTVTLKIKNRILGSFDLTVEGQSISQAADPKSTASTTSQTATDTTKKRSRRARAK